MEFIIKGTKYIIEDGIIKNFNKKGELKQIIFIDKINWIYRYGDYGITSKLQLHMNGEKIDLITKDFDQAKDMLNTILEEKLKAKK